jgi:hypothetical protein
MVVMKSLNSYLDLLQRKVYEARQPLLHHGHSVTAENTETLQHTITGKREKLSILRDWKIMVLRVYLSQ